MAYKARRVILGLYNIFLSLGATYTGIEMSIGYGAFQEYPKEWLTKVPFVSWVLPGIIGILVFGIGNLVAAIYCFKGIERKAWRPSLFMASLFLISMIVQYRIFQEWYLASAMFLILSLVQVLMTAYIILDYRKSKLKAKAA